MTIPKKLRALFSRKKPSAVRVRRGRTSVIRPSNRYEVLCGRDL